jgi:hypothetical protein
MSVERQRVDDFGKLEDGLRKAGDWYVWGPYMSERQWGTVREDYSSDGEAWNYLPHDHARSRAYRWGEDGLAGFCDIEQRLCLGLALWNGQDPILKERIYGLTGQEGNHGEDAKEYWWYLDAVPSHAWNRWRYHYPQRAFPYEQLRQENARRGKLDLEYELIDTHIFDEDRFWVTEVDYAKDGPFDILMTVRVTNAGPEPATVHVLPTAWFRNTWSWEIGAPRPEMMATGPASAAVRHPFLGELELVGGEAPDGSSPTLLFCENETNDARLYGGEPSCQYPKDGINDHVVTGAATVNPDRRGTKCAFWYQLPLDPGGTAEIRVRLSPQGANPDPSGALGKAFEKVVNRCRAEADEFYAELTPAGAGADEAMVMRQAFSGMLWSKQLYYYDVARWLKGDPAQPAPPASRWTGRNARWQHFDAFDIMSMPDKWEYPWFAAWDLAFHCVALAHVDPAFAKYQLVLLCREWFQHPDGELPAYEWDFSDVNPPVQAWAALQVFAIDGGRDLAFLSRIFDKLLVNFTWWVNQRDQDANNVFEGGFLGLDNIGPIDRSHIPAGASLQQSDATGWMAAYSLAMGAIAAVLNRSGQRPGEDLVLKFLEHFAAIRESMESRGMWDDVDGLYYDRLVTGDGATVVFKVRSMVGIIPTLAAMVVDEGIVGEAAGLAKGFARFLQGEGLGDLDELKELGVLRGEAGAQRLLLGVVNIQQLERIVAKVLDEKEFLSPYGLRALSAFHRDEPYELDTQGIRASIDYEPAESTTNMFGGNSNWRGPIWFPLNYLVIEALERYDRFFGEDLNVEYPTGSGNRITLGEVAQDLRRRLVSLFLVGDDGRRPCFGYVGPFQTDPAWKDNILFHEYFHGDNGAGLGASHQTGWTGLVADLIRRRHGAVPELGDVLRQISPSL